MKSLFNWYKLLRSEGYGVIESWTGALYNNKTWYPEGTWPYGMKLKEKKWKKNIGQSVQPVIQKLK